MDDERSQDGPPASPGDAPARRTPARFEDALVACRLFVLVPVVVLALGALGSFAYGTDLFVLAVHDVAVAALPVGNKIGQILVIIDLFLIGATLLIASIGFYELFVDRITAREHVRLPDWLQMRDLNDLKARVISMIVLITAIDFVDTLVDPTGGVDVLERGAAVAVVIGALTAYVRFSRNVHEG